MIFELHMCYIVTLLKAMIIGRSNLSMLFKLGVMNLDWQIFGQFIYFVDFLSIPSIVKKINFQKMEKNFP